ncbi:retropepsin-like aspartic protease [Leeuwenhoekiella sp. CH_XMU1409-2]|uniref:retropepsin-like aspartic protease n=1 Tax=Leeuwenhoekiella sp. CH_XMU1409-2 TaxID=3107768 RepID=UPI00300A2855
MKTCNLPILQRKGKRLIDAHIRISNPSTGKSQAVKALIDTGADVCMLPMMLANYLGLPFDDAHKSNSNIKGVTGKALETYEYDLQVDVLDVTMRNIVHTLTVKFKYGRNNLYPPILGTEGFLEHSKLTVDYIKHMITLEF